MLNVKEAFIASVFELEMSVGMELLKLSDAIDCASSSKLDLTDGFQQSASGLGAGGGTTGGGVAAESNENLQPTRINNPKIAIIRKLISNSTNFTTS